MPAKPVVVSLPMSWLAAAGAAYAQDVSSTPADVYVPAVLLVRINPDYPTKAMEAGGMGAVTLNFIVSKDGKVTEARVVRSVGDVLFEDAALAALRQWRYNPATLNREAVEQNGDVIINFSLSGDIYGVRPDFKRQYETVVKALESGKLERAERELMELDSIGRANHFEDAWFWFAKYYFLEATGSTDTKERLRSLELAVGNVGDYLEPDLLVPAAQRLYALYGQKLDLSSAVRIYEKLEDSAVAQEAASYQETLAAMMPSYERILVAISGEQMFSMSSEVDERGFWRHDLLRRSFSVENVVGSLASLQLRCERGSIQRYVDIREDAIWAAPDDRGRCTVFIEGEPGTTFVFEEYPLSYGRGASGN